MLKNLFVAAVVFASLAAAASPVGAQTPAPGAAPGAIPAPTAVPISGPKNVIIMIADGAGYNVYKAAAMYEGNLGKQVYEGPGWTRYSVAPSSLRKDPGRPVEGEAGLKQEQYLIYDPVMAWNDLPVDTRSGAFSHYFKGYRWLRDTNPDSANTATAMSTGVETYTSAMNVDGNGKPLLTIAEIAKGLGKSVGTGSSVPLSHATPAALGGAHNKSRDSYAQIANEMLTAGILDVIFGTGNPDYDWDGKPIIPPDRKSVV
jgi:alkaline phosphatase